MKRPIRIEGNIAYVPLTKGYEAVIDAADVPLVDGFNWCAQVQSHTVYAQRKDRSGPKPRTVLLHRVIAGEPEGFDIDHRDGNGLDNRRANLRDATKAQNQHNARISKRNTSGFKGVMRNNRNSKWQAMIGLNRKQHHLGFFNCPTAAYFAYIKASRALHGEFGRIA